jgi:hypothetical protein
VGVDPKYPDGRFSMKVLPPEFEEDADFSRIDQGNCISFEVSYSYPIYFWMFENVL